MGVEILNRTYTNPFKPASTTTWLLGNVGDWLRLDMTVAISVKEVFEVTGDTLILSDPDKLILSGGKTWKERGFDVGMIAILDYKSIITGGTNSNTVVPFTVISILGYEMQVVPTVGGTWAGWGDQSGIPMPGYKNADTITKDVIVYATKQVEGLQLDYTHITNDSVPSGNLASHIDGTITSLVKEQVDLMVAFAPAVDWTHELNFKSGLSLIKSNIRYLGPAGIEYQYQIQLFFMISPFYDDITNLQNNIAPDSVKGVSALTDNMLLKALPTYNNPNVSITNEPKKTAQLGNTGWFDENFNQLPNPFTFTTPVYTNLAGTVVSQLDYANPVVMTTTISGLTTFAGAKFQYGFIWCPIDEDVYKDTEFPYHESMKVSTGGQADSLNDVFSIGVNHSPFPAIREGYSRQGVGVESMDASDISFIQNGTDIDVSITFRPTTGFATFFGDKADNERQYVLWVSIGDPAPDSNETDRVSLKLDFNTMDTYVEPIGEWDGMTINFLDHPQDYTDTPIPCGNQLFVEDDLLAKIEWSVDTATDPTIPIPTGQVFGVLAQRISDGFQYVLDKNSVDLTQYPDPTQYNFDASRGFKLGVGNTKNWFKVDYDAPGVGTLEDVLSWYGFKVRWEDWIKRFPVPPNDFYLNTEAQNGLNNDWYHYFTTAGWELYFYVDTQATLNGTAVTYQNLKSMSINDYDSTVKITTSMATYQDNNGVKGAAISAGGGEGVILDNEFVWLDITYTSATPIADWADQPTVDANVYATQCIEVDGGAGQKSFRQLSSIWLPELDNPMVPLPSETLAKIVWISNLKIRVETRIEANKLIDASRYRISGRIGCK